MCEKTVSADSWILKDVPDQFIVCAMYLEKLGHREESELEASFDY